MAKNKIYEKAAEYIAKKYFFYDDAKRISSGTMGTAFSVDNDRKVLKLTTDVDEALRAERIRGKHFKNLMGYYTVKKIKSSNSVLNGMHCLLMDKLPKVLTDDEIAEDIFIRYEDMYRVAFNSNDMPGYEINTPNSLKKFIKNELSQKRFYDNLSDEYKVVAERMWFDLIQIRKQLRKCGIITNDITRGNLGFDSYGNLIFFDMGYPGSGRKELRNKEIQVQIEEPKEKPFKLKKLKPKVVESFNNFVLFETIEVEI